MKLRPNCAARTVAADILPIIEISQKVGIPIEVSCFIGSSPIRQYAEDWDLDRMLRMTEDAVALAVKAGLPVMYVTEDTTRAHPDHIRRMYTAAIRAGAERVCVCDTVGHATPNGVQNLIRFVVKVVNEANPGVKVDWHGHQDRGFAVTNALWALEAGAHRVHACALGIGERVGNTAMDQLLVNLQLLGWIDRDLTALHDYCSLVSEATGVRIPDNYPVVGRDAFRTGTGVHAAAIIKARKKGDDWLADRVYSRRPGQHGRPPADDRGGTHVRSFQRAVLAREPRHRGAPGARRGHLPPREGERPGPFRRRDPGRRSGFPLPPPRRRWKSSTAPKADSRQTGADRRGLSASEACRLISITSPSREGFRRRAWRRTGATSRPCVVLSSGKALRRLRIATGRLRRYPEARCATRPLLAVGLARALRSARVLPVSGAGHWL